MRFSARAIPPPVGAIVCQRIRPAFTSYSMIFLPAPKPLDGAPALITSLRTRLRVGLITNADNDILQQSILRQGFLFDFVVTSEDARCCKPSPAIFERALKQLDLSADRLLMVGDSPDRGYHGGQPVRYTGIVSQLARPAGRMPSGWRSCAAAQGAQRLPVGYP